MTYEQIVVISQYFSVDEDDKELSVEAAQAQPLGNEKIIRVFGAQRARGR